MQDYTITSDDLRNVNWQELLASCDKKECWNYSTVFIRKAKEAEEAEDEKQFAIYRLLARISSFWLCSDNKDEPFGAKFTIGNKRGALPNDLTPDELQALAGIVGEIEDAEMRARVADVLWLCKRDHTFAEIAINAYLQSSMVLEDPKHWPSGFHRIERSYRIALSMSAKASVMEKVIGHIEGMIEKYAEDDPLYFSVKLMALLQENKFGDALKFSAIADALAKRSERQGDWNKARTQWEAKAKWDKIAGNVVDARSSKISAAETYVRLAEGSTSNMVASSHLQRGIEAYRRIGESKDRIEELHKILLEREKKTLKELAPISTSVDINDLVDHAIASVREKSLPEAICVLAIGVEPQKVSTLRSRLEDSVKIAPFSHFIDGVLINSQGKVIGRRPGLLTKEGPDKEAAIRSHLLGEAVMGRSLVVQGWVNPIVRFLYQNHNVRLDDIAQFVLNNPFIPEGRERLYAEGLLAGFRNDFMVACHILIPQLENSLRHIFTQMDVVTSSLDSEGIQKEHDLNRLLFLPEGKKVFGEDLLFDLQGLLVEPEGSNMRNNMAHGLLDYAGFYSADSVYTWAIILRICCWPSIVKTHSNQQGDRITPTAVQPDSSPTTQKADI